jgi:8-oxo-dGTP pyrophosphatase MutT (NUDIX family)
MQIEETTQGRFIVRVYGFLINSRKEILIAYEYHFDRPMVKLPGGGLQFGEGPYDAIRRELVEELEFKIDGGVQFHTTDFFARSAFNDKHQLLGIYYLIDSDAQLEEMFRTPVVHPEVNGGLDFRWVGMEELKTLQLTFPTDRQALQKFIQYVEGGLIRWPEKI